MPSADELARKQSRKITAELERERRELAAYKKILLLGTSESGKSTVLKQMKLIHTGKLDSGTTSMWKDVIRDNMLTGVRKIIGFINAQGLPLAQPQVQANLEALLGGDLTSADHLSAVAAALEAWRDEPSVSVAIHRGNEFDLLEAASCFISEAEEVLSPSYVPNTQDIIWARQPTLAVCETRLNMDGQLYRVFDVAGARSERHKWPQFFDDVTCIIFVAALSSYDQMLPPPDTISRLEEALKVFEQVCSQPLIIRTAIILFLNKMDLLEQKLDRSPVAKYFPDYTGGASMDAVTKYFARTFTKRFTNNVCNKDRKFYMYFTCAADSQQIKAVLATVNSIILKLNLSAVQLI
ncbi:guanine nucleotide-binding protein subunit alpha [Sorochytrium milnesiophthora]